MSLPIDFSAEQYLYLHPDVRLAGIDPAVHYLTWGHQEGRPYLPNSDPLLPKVKGEFHSDGVRTVHNHDFMSDPRYIAATWTGTVRARCSTSWTLSQVSMTGFYLLTRKLAGSRTKAKSGLKMELTYLTLMP